MPTINMRSSADMVKGQGVGSCYEEQVKLVSEGLPATYTVTINRHKKCDVAHYHTINLNYYFERLLKKKNTAGVGYVHFLPDTMEESLRLPKLIKPLFYRYLLSFYNSMDYLVAVNPTVIKKLENYGINNPTIVYIPNFVSEEVFFPHDIEKIRKTQDKYGLDQEKYTVMGVGQLQTRKGIADFVKTAENLPDMQFIWAGGFSFGKITDGYEGIKKIVDNCPDNVKFLGIVERHEMADLYNAADIMLLPSFDELFPMSILEAFCCKTPVMLRDIPVYPDILFDSYLKGNNVEEFTFELTKLKNDSKIQEYWKEKAWEIHMFYTKDNILKMWENLYMEAYNKVNKDVEEKKARTNKTKHITNE